MPTHAQMFRLFNELIFVLLGVLLIVMALAGRYAHPGRSAPWIILGVILFYWGLRIWMRSTAVKPNLESRVRAGSLALVGAMVLAIAWLPFPYAGPLLAAAGGGLALRGLLSCVLLVRTL